MQNKVEQKNSGLLFANNVNVTLKAVVFMVDLTVLGLWLDLRILKVFFNLNDPMILY